MLFYEASAKIQSCRIVEKYLKIVMVNEVSMIRMRESGVILRIVQ